MASPAAATAPAKAAAPPTSEHTTAAATTSKVDESKKAPTSPTTESAASPVASATTSAATPAPAAVSSPAAPTPAPAKDASASAAKELPLPDEPDGIINMEIFSQIQDMDDEDDEEGGHEFSKGIVWGYFEQAEATFQQMEEAIAEPSLWKLSSLGHFLKGSSAALGIIKVQESCEKMQHYGNLRDEEVGVALSEEEALKRIKALLVDCKRDYSVASRWLRRLYDEGA